MHRETLVIVTPALASANNGNWQTARRWASRLRPAYRVHLTDRWAGDAGVDAALMIALHARRSAGSIVAWREAHPARPLMLVLTGTDLYRDIAFDDEARRSLDLADVLVVLNEVGAMGLPERLRARARVVLQSCSERQALPKTRQHLRALMVGHLRDEKDPRTWWRAVNRLAARADMRFDHIGAALDPSLGAEAAALTSKVPAFRWLGGLAHGVVRRHIQAAHVLVHASRMEGGAHVVIEAIRSGTPVLASRIPGNVGMLGADYGGYFALDDAPALAQLLLRCRDERARPEGLYALLQRQCAARAPLFAPQAESAAVQALVRSLLPAPPASR